MPFARIAQGLWAAALLVSHVAQAATPEETLATLRVPDGFTVELAAAAPQVGHPVMAGFDDKGRLYLADNAGLNLPADELLKQLPNMIRRLEDADGDGRFEKSTLYADKMTFPQGAAWFRGALYVASPPSIWKLEDTDDDGVADKRTELVKQFGFIGNAADIHGCFITPSGRIAWCDGRHGHEFKDAGGTTTSKGQAARIFTCLPDGSDVQVFCGGGMDNPVEVAFTPDGDTIGTMTFFNPDDVRHDALMHFVHGGVYPRKHPCVNEFKRTGELLPALSRFGVTAPSGLCRHEGAGWGEEYRDNFFSAQFNTHKIVRHKLTRQGTTYTSADDDFLTSTSPDFHPTDVLVDADGSLLVIDTGGWFRIGCPTSQIAKPEIGGAIYRIRRTGAAPIADSRGLKIDWDRTSDTEMAELLSDPRPAVVERAIEFLVTRGDAAMGALATGLFEPTDYRLRENAIWALVRIGTPNARLLLRQALADDEPGARQAAVQGVSDLRDPESIYSLIDMLTTDQPPVRRAAAAALGRLQNADAVPALLKGLQQPADRFEEHALIYALIEINNREATLKGLQDSNPNVRRGAVIALDQMDDGRLTRELIAPLLGVDDAPLLRTLVDILGRHPDWSGELSSTLAGWLALPRPTPEQLGMIRGAVTAFAVQPATQKLVAEALTNPKTVVPTRLALLEAIAASEFPQPPEIWTEALRRNLEHANADVARQTIVAVSSLGAKPFGPSLMKIGLNAKAATELRLAALTAAAQAGGPLPKEAFYFATGQLRSSQSLPERLAAAEVLGSFDLDANQQVVLLEFFQTCSPLEISWLLRAFEQNNSAMVGNSLLAALNKPSVLASLSAERVRQTFARYPASLQTAADELLARAAPDQAERGAKLATIVEAASAGNAARGEEVFFSQRAACSACHRIAGRGERIGPDLSKIGEIRTRRDLAESILFPSVSLARGFESFSIVTHDGRVHNGLLSRETAGAIYLRTPERSEVRIERKDIDQHVPSTTSIMPQGLEKTLTPAELADVVVYLESLK